MPRNIPTTKARQGMRGRPVLVVLIISLALVAVVWAIVEFYGQSIKPDPQESPTYQG
jgi:hypothetical protein